MQSSGLQRMPGGCQSAFSFSCRHYYIRFFANVNKAVYASGRANSRM